MSTTAIVEPAPRLERRARTGLTGAWLLSGAMMLSGVLTYVFHVLAARSLGPSAYGQIAILWAAMFLVSIVLFRPLEQTTSRAIADRLARNEETGTVIRSVGAMCVAVVAAVGVAMVFAGDAVADQLFSGDRMLVARSSSGSWRTEARTSSAASSAACAGSRGTGSG